MPRATCIVSPELREKLYAYAYRGDICIIKNVLFDESNAFLEIVSDLIPPECDTWHVDVILDEGGLRFKRDQDV